MKENHSLQAKKYLDGKLNMNINSALFRRLILGAMWNTFILGCLLFIFAWRLDWARAWILLGILFLGSLFSIYGLRNHDELLKERLKLPWQAGQPLLDKILVTLLLISFLGLFIFIPLDVFDWHIFAKPRPAIAFLGLGLFGLGWGMIYLTFKENAFAAPVVRIQKERNQKVIETGIYRFIRHPMYAGVILYLVGITLWLESYAAALLVLLPLAILALRIVYEERFLRSNLPGYDAYTKKVIYRLIPYIW